jgi:hypothetical protein
MIVEAVKKQTIEVDVDPVTVIVDIFDIWRQLNNVPYGAELRSGYWMNYERQGHDSDWVQKRLATPEEIEAVNAFKVVANIAKEID